MDFEVYIASRRKVFRRLKVFHIAVEVMKTLCLIAAICLNLVSVCHADEYGDCRKSQTTEQIIECIEKGIWSPCDEGAGPTSWLGSQCAWATAEIGARKLRAIEQEISKRFRARNLVSAQRKFLSSQKKWRSFVEDYCKFVNDADDSGLFVNDPNYLTYGSCLSRLTDQRVRELSYFLDE